MTTVSRRRGLQLPLAEVEGGSLEGVEEESGNFRIELAGGDKTHDLHERDSGGVGVFEDMFSPMTSFTECPETSFTLQRERSRRWGCESDGVEDDGRA